MVPFHTFLALILILLAASSCSQMEPPHPDASQKALAAEQAETAQGNNPNELLANPNERVSFPNPGVAQVDLTGPDALTMYDLLAISPSFVSGTELQIKDGMNFTCVDSAGAFSCGFPIHLADGKRSELLPRAQVVAGKPLVDQSGFTVQIQMDAVMELPMSISPSKARLYIPGAPAKALYDALLIPEVPGEVSDKFSYIGEKDSDAVECTKQVLSVDGTENYFCDLFLDVAVGAIDKPTEDSLFYH